MDLQAQEIKTKPCLGSLSSSTAELDAALCSLRCSVNDTGIHCLYAQRRAQYIITKRGIAKKASGEIFAHEGHAVK